MFRHRGAIIRELSKQMNIRPAPLCRCCVVLIKTINLINILKCQYINLGHAVAQLVKALRYKSEGNGFDFRWCHWNFSFT
jgi:hypothetical protein